MRIDTFEEGSSLTDCVAGETQSGTWSEENGVYTVTMNGEASSSTADFSDNNNFTTETTFEGQAVKLKFTRQ